ncbi:2-C-methyl-D-erythritol 2,4-cyclodiphosphate synthase [Halanaerobium hydrogeniformans]|uniref:2-C-methyl-D-erythritol 2,4-cyclodiphosphate synthase n=1 Tax=Halanaerobium hydrogeniformans TaxID=656519 RepID=E4RJE2_HALHG|nr:2-C-methyl-D-erythritol 2,4-cyclodiphosphate synthase [Halanaerobium hydrogeniformans]ADQ15362.1 2C-methyl-D-erythritol 2,4-cyclodiphosphate synthase [Halanaerobium hydrogeniformans]
MLKVGFGYDSHRFIKGRKLILGGVEILSEFGLKGHSDADLLIHALIDALLGALGSGDIGTHFPDDVPEYKDISSSKLLKKIVLEVNKEGFLINNCDLQVVAEKPKLQSYREQIVNSLADDLEITKDKINFKATTNEKMGFVGREEGMAAFAVVSIIEKRLWNFYNSIEGGEQTDDVS